ncbi:hypothetical protein KKB83_02245 [Patescibacteria group bacterium]|nr:hypothetical protein [Patescibacteria group bacterium]
MNKLKYLLFILFLIILAILGYVGKNYYDKHGGSSATPTVTPQPTTITSATAVPTPKPTAQEPETEEIYQNGNIYAVYNKPTAETSFTLNQPRVIYSIQNYHWNSAQGNESSGTIGLKDQDGKTYGPWETTGAIGQGGVPNAYWTCYPNLELPAGIYTITDSDPDTWSQNSGSGGQGMTRVFAVK